MTDAFTGRRVLVTGAAGAFGAGTVTALRERGAAVAGLDQLSADTVAVTADVADDDSVAAAVAVAVDQLGGLDAVVHFAGIGIPNDAGGAVTPDVRAVVEVNLLGSWRVTAAALPALLAAGTRAGRRPQVVLTASEMAFVNLPFGSAYMVSKRGLTAYADGLRLEYPQLAVTTVCPGYVRTGIHEASDAAGVSMSGTVRRERVADIVNTVLRALASRRPARLTATTRLGGVELWFARHAPTLVDAVVRNRVRRHVRSGRWTGSPLARGLTRRYRDGAAAPAEHAAEVPR